MVVNLSMSSNRKRVINEVYMTTEEIATTFTMGAMWMGRVPECKDCKIRHLRSKFRHKKCLYFFCNLMEVIACIGFKLYSFDYPVDDFMRFSNWKRTRDLIIEENEGKSITERDDLIEKVEHL